MSLFENLVITEFDIPQSIRNRFNNLRPNEISFVQKSIFECLNYLISNNKIKLSRQFNDGYVHRAGTLKSGNSIDGFMPVSKAKASGCGDMFWDTEAIWFGKESLPRYIGINEENPYGLLSCRQLKNIDNIDNTILAFINLSTKRIPLCSSAQEQTAVLLSKSIQEHFNKCMVIPMVRIYSTQADGYPNTDLIYEQLITNQGTITLDKKVWGYHCDARYVNSNPTLKSVLESWDYSNGYRLSEYQADRLQIDVFFKILDIMNEILKYYGKNIINNTYTALVPNLTGVKILGWTCEDTPRARDCSTFPGEIAIPLKYLTKPDRYGIFEKQHESCKPRFYQKDAFGRLKEVYKDDPDMIAHLQPYMLFGGKKEIDIKNKDLMLLNSGPEKIKLTGRMSNIEVDMPKENKLRKLSVSVSDVDMSKENKLPELSANDLEINQIFVTSPEEEKLYTNEDKKISDFFSKIIEKEKEKEKEKEEEYVGGKKYKLNSKKRYMSKKTKKTKKTKKRSMSKI